MSTICKGQMQVYNWPSDNQPLGECEAVERYGSNTLYINTKIFCNVRPSRNVNIYRRFGGIEGGSNISTALSISHITNIQKRCYFLIHNNHPQFFGSLTTLFQLCYVTSSSRITVIMINDNSYERKRPLPFTFVWPCIVTNFFVMKPTRCTNFTNLLWHETLHVSESSSVHYQEIIHCTLNNGLCHTGL